jgi:hypothetical protein
MKLAICLYGNIGIPESASQRQGGINLLKESGKANTDPEICYQALKDYFIDKYETDIFIHSWSKNYENILKDIYNPKNYKFENQIDFSTSVKEYGISDSNQIEDWEISRFAKESYELLLPSRKSVGNIKKELNNLAFRTHSRWYSTQESVKLMSLYANLNSIEYDYVLLTRFDCLFKKPIDLSSLDKNNFYCSRRKNRDDYEMALFDFFFLSSQENIQKFSELYKNIYNYSIRPTFASMEHALTFLQKNEIKNIIDFKDGYDKAIGNVQGDKRNFKIIRKIFKKISNQL